MAGVVAGASQVGEVLKMLWAGSVPQLEADGSRTDALQGSGAAGRVPTGGAGARCDDESGDGCLPVSKTCRRGRSPPVLWQGSCVAIRDLLWRADYLWRRNGDDRYACA